MVSDLLGPVGISLARAVGILQWQCEGPVMYAYPLFLYNKKKATYIMKNYRAKARVLFCPYHGCPTGNAEQPFSMEALPVPTFAPFSPCFLAVTGLCSF